MGLLLLDLDGTIVDDALVEIDGKLQRPQDQLFHEPVLRPNVYDRLRSAALDGDRFAIVTNQGGVAWGYHTQAEVRARIGRTLALLDFFWGQPFSVRVAWKHPRATIPQFKGDDGRKPSSQMLQEAIVVADILPQSLGDVRAPVLMVGDREEDREAAAAVKDAAGGPIDFQLAGDFFGW